ncbi:hypothetical protein [Neobacillus sp. Marseille-QA0830]
MNSIVKKAVFWGMLIAAGLFALNVFQFLLGKLPLIFGLAVLVFVIKCLRKK